LLSQIVITNKFDSVVGIIDNTYSAIKKQSCLTKENILTNYTKQELKMGFRSLRFFSVSALLVVVGFH